jgi:hypothetical protein
MPELRRGLRVGGPADHQQLNDDWSVFSATLLQDRQDLVRLALGDDTILTIGPDGDLRHESP